MAHGLETILFNLGPQWFLNTNHPKPYNVAAISILLAIAESDGNHPLEHLAAWCLVKTKLWSSSDTDNADTTLTCKVDWSGAPISVSRAGALIVVSPVRFSAETPGGGWFSGRLSIRERNDDITGRKIMPCCCLKLPPSVSTEGCCMQHRAQPSSVRSRWALLYRDRSYLGFQPR